MYKFEERFYQYLREEYVTEYERNHIKELKRTQPIYYYQEIERYYNERFPSLRFYVLFSTEIQEFPTNPIYKIWCSFRLFIKHIFHMRPDSIQYMEFTMNSGIPIAKVLAFYEWVPDEFYECLIKYF